jgi:RNA polymerase sigma-70 factor (ECF subfamily)
VHFGPSPEEEYRKAELHEHLISPALRTAFQLRDLDDLSTSESAHILGVANGTVKSQVARARAKLTRLVGRALDAKPRSSAPRTLLQVSEGK